jgi:FKBP-type peptidyl-prolyl cis-trans isomerase
MTASTAPSVTTVPSLTATTAPSITVTASATSSSTTRPTNTITAATAVAASGQCTPGNGKTVTTASELKIEDLLICNGAEVKQGMNATIHYIASVRGGSRFFNSYDRGQPLTFVVGSDQVVRGLNEGIIGMKVGGKRRLTIPPILGYGNQSRPGVPANSTLVYEIELLNVR